MNTHAPHSASERGFIALISVVIISAILMALMAAEAAASFWARLDSLGGEEKASARALAGSCVNVALRELATSSDPAHYAPSGQVVPVGIDAQGNALNCTIQSVAHAQQTVTVQSYASSGGSFGAIAATVSLPPDIRVISWSEQ